VGACGLKTLLTSPDIFVCYCSAIAKETTMTLNHMILFYVKNPLASAAFYTRLLGEKPIDASPGFAMFKVNDTTMLGLWNAAGVEPKPEVAAGASELAFQVADIGQVDDYHKRWSQEEFPIAQRPTQMDFGYTFTALDPDGHRLRVFAAS
jgi:catechol 2,3-dioxygenase-like lactoylglutathione lyase family enzyme